ncbi:MAG: hypothetical protein WCA04_02560 [Geobacteraceae bacterium]
MAIGGVRGKAAGTARGTITQVGSTIEEPRVFIHMYRQAGEIITGIIVGTDRNGTISEFLSASFSGTGEPGKETSIGNVIITGVCKGNISRNLEDTNRNVRSRNTRRHQNIPTLVMENLKEGVGTEGTKGRIAHCLFLYEKAAIITFFG